MLAWLCNICDDYGHTNFDVVAFTTELGETISTVHVTELGKQVPDHQRYPQNQVL